MNTTTSSVQLEAGQALDIIMHEQVMAECAHILMAADPQPDWIKGYKSICYRCQKCNKSLMPRLPGCEGMIEDVPPYSKDLRDAGRILIHLTALGYRYVVRGNFQGDGQHWAGFDKQDWADTHPLYDSGPGASLPLAICRAALKAMEARRNAE